MGIVRRPAARLRAEQLLAKRRYAGLQKLDLPDGCDVVDRFLVGTHSDLAAPQQAEALGVPVSSVHTWRKALYERGLLRREETATHARIAPAEAEAIARLWSEGWSRCAIAAARDIHESRVVRALRHVGVAPFAPRRRWLGTADVRQIFGVEDGAVHRWVACGWLPDIRPVAGAALHFQWAMDDLVALVRNRASWVAWEPPQIADAQLRRLAEHERRAARGRWFQMQEVARLLGIAAGNLSTWRTRYALFDDLPAGAWVRGRYVWLADAQIAQLEAWGADVRRHRPGSDAHRWAANALKHRLIAAYGRPETYQAAAD